jgi:nitroreductase
MSFINYYDTIFKRKSVRKYDMTHLEDEILNEVSKKLNQLKHMYPDIRTEMKMVTEKDVKSLMQIKAPHYIMVFSEAREGYLTNVGFMLQQMDLYLSEKGLGSCWQGMPKPTKEILSSSEFEFVIVLAFGKPMEPLYRKDVSEFKRKPLSEVTDIPASDQIFEPVRLAPSAGNSQPWFFTGDMKRIHAYGIKPGFIKALLFEKMNKVDMGISLCHLWLALKSIGKDVEFVQDSAAKANTPSGKYYVASAKVDE